MKILAIATLVALAACQPGVEITEDEYGEEWPLTVDSARLWCQPPQAVMLRAEGTTYGLNGPAQSRLDMPPPDRIWRMDSSAPQGSGVKVSIRPLLERGLDMCER